VPQGIGPRTDEPATSYSPSGHRARCRHCVLQGYVGLASMVVWPIRVLGSKLQAMLLAKLRNGPQQMGTRMALGGHTRGWLRASLGPGRGRSARSTVWGSREDRCDSGRSRLWQQFAGAIDDPIEAWMLRCGSRSGCAHTSSTCADRAQRARRGASVSACAIPAISKRIQQTGRLTAAPRRFIVNGDPAVAWRRFVYRLVPWRCPAVYPACSLRWLRPSRLPRGTREHRATTR